MPAPSPTKKHCSPLHYQQVARTDARAVADKEALPPPVGEPRALVPLRRVNDRLELKRARRDDRGERGGVGARTGARAGAGAASAQQGRERGGARSPMNGKEQAMGRPDRPRAPQQALVDDLLGKLELVRDVRRVDRREHRVLCGTRTREQGR